ARRRAVFEALRAQDIGVNVHYIPVHMQPYYRRLGGASEPLPEAERYYAEAISLPMYATLIEQDQDRVVRVLREALCS
ncbi:MAG TPA: DegT/DnrJ/EryC1/StrS family aminotransferase, partial [Burkholderiaceae bacterium]|nr:DegT/DnrJ/EryC1/StrS family aminotransferase [Burkholderiaceae bacterium]